MRKANAANSTTSQFTKSNAKGNANNATVVTNTNIARPTTIHATVEENSNSQSNDPKHSMSVLKFQTNGKCMPSNAEGWFVLQKRYKDLIRIFLCFENIISFY